MLKVNLKSGEIWLHDVIGSSWFDEGITSLLVSDALDALDGKRATIRINSPGGSADEGIGIYNILKGYSGGVDTVNDSLAASAASVIFLAGENRTASKGSRVMIHRAMTFDIGNATQLRKTANLLETYDKSLVDIYSQFMGGANVMDLLDAETWYGAQDSIAAGLATTDGVETDAVPVAASWMKHPPKDLVAASFRYRERAAVRNRFSKVVVK